MPTDDFGSLPGRDTTWATVRNYVEPIVAELDSPNETLLVLRVVIPGNDAVSVSAEFHASVSPTQRTALLRYAGRLVDDAAERTGTRGSPDEDQ